ncbi:Ankyrin repeat domain-containing protein 44 [Mycoblastus sanguinarius]|nr:Ankyrin repeat domain-containing protein 44 [Mycoblastus sanguinarius]
MHILTTDGRFRWVSLQLDYLATLHTVSDVRHRLGRLPEHLSGSYDELYNRTLNRYEPEERKCLEIALSLLLVPLRPPPHVFSQFVLWNEDDEDSDDDSNYDDDDDNDDNDDNDDDSGDGNSDGDGDDDEDNDNANEEDDVDSTSAISDLSTSEERDGLWSQRAAARYSDGVTRLCFGLVIFDKTTHSFRLAHTSVQDYLLNQRSEYQTVCVNYARLAERCIFILLQTCTVSSIYPKYHEDERKIVTTASGQSLENSDKFGPRDEPSFFDGPSYDSKDWLVSIFWVEEHWAYYTAKSERHRQSSPLMQLETQLRDLVIQQPWESVRPMMFFSACRDGLRDLVEKWARAHPQLTRTALRHPRGTTALLETCCGDDSWPDIVEMLITLGADFGYVNEEGETPLYGALIRNHEAVVSLLLKNGPSLANCQLRLGLSGAKDVFSPLHVTIRKHRDKALPVAKVLLDYGADVNATDSMGLGALHPVKLMSVELLELLLDNGADIDTKTPDNRTPLMLAVLGNKLELCKKLVARGADLSTKDLNGWTALGIAAHNGQENLARLLIESGIDVNSRQQKYGATALHLAAREGHIGVAKLLMESKIEISAVTEDGWTALHLATWEGHEKLAKSLIASGLGINGRASMGRTALHLAAEQGHNNIVKALISSKIDISAVDDNGYTAVHVAALGGHTKLVKLLIASGLDIDRRSNLGRTALHLAAERGDDNMANALIGSNVFVDARDTSAQTALHLAAFGANESTVSLLLASGAEPNLFSHSGQTPLFKAALHESVETMERLLPDTTNINTQDCDGDTPLSMAASQGHLANVQLLLDNGAEIVPQEPGPYCGFLDPEERVEGYGRDALLTAWLDGHEDVVRTILESAIEREPESEYSIALRLLTEKETGAFGTWMEARRANATENREDIESFRKEIEERADALIEENRRKIALELGVEPYQEHV